MCFYAVVNLSHISKPFFHEQIVPFLNECCCRVSVVVAMVIQEI